MVYNQLEKQTLNYNSKYLVYLKSKEMSWCVKLADTLLGKLNNVLLEQYRKSDSRQRQIFKERISKGFPSALILEQIRNDKINQG
jgi:hypothetical protein